MTKKFIAAIYLMKGRAIRSLKDQTIVELDPVRLARYYCEQNIDELMVFDLSQGDAEHEEALDCIKEICEACEVDVIGLGNIKRMEDVKKLLYAGCKKAALNFDLESNRAILEEVSLKFGKEKILAGFSQAESFLQNIEVLNQFVSGLVVINSHIATEIEDNIHIPTYIQLNQAPLNQLLDVLKKPYIAGITGNTVNDNVKEVQTLKDMCKEQGYEVEGLQAAIPFSELRLNSDGLIPVIVQDYKTKEVLMMAYMNEQAYLDTLRTGKMNYYSRSRKSQWLKGETSGHYQYVKALCADCDKDTLLATVSQVGVACHTGAKSCFFNEIAKKNYSEPDNPLQVFEEVFSVIKDRKLHPKEGSYTNYLFDKGIDKILKKLGEEATEIVIAAKNPNANEVKYEISDFLYHMMVLMVEKDVTWKEITTELANR